MVGVEVWRVAQVVVDRGPGRRSSFGSGYLAAPGVVLTAAHVLADAVVVRVRLDVRRDGAVEVDAESWLAVPGYGDVADVAVITIAADATGNRPAVPVLFGGMRDCAAVLAVQALGFPRFKARGRSGSPEVYRDLEHVVAHSPVSANRRQGTMAVYIDDPPPAMTSGDSSPWEGMSGAAVWVGERIVAVLAEHHRGEGAGRLTARRIDRMIAEIPSPARIHISQLLRLPHEVSTLPDVVPADPVALARSAYLAQVREIAPDVLVGRDAELAEWAEFCAGPKSYRWWQAGPWAGKTALASWFVLHPPTGTEVVSFFVMARIAGQSDSGAFLDAMTSQLQALESASPVVAPDGIRVGTWLSLLESVASHASERGRRLVIVVDGLDEDDAGATPVSGGASIASLLPRHPPPGARFVLTSRPQPGLPEDVPPDHPLRACSPRTLAGSRVAQNIEFRAMRELRDLLSVSQVTVDVIGYIAGAGGGLTSSDLAGLTQAPPHVISQIVRGVAGRSLEARALAGLHGLPSGETGYAFAHDALRVLAETQLGSGELSRYREQIHEWMNSYASAGWPESTPMYAINAYPGLLRTTRDVTRMSALARDPRRHALLLRVFGSEYAALTETRAALRMAADQDDPDVQVITEISAHHFTISIRNRFHPAALPGVWARIGHFDHAEIIARLMDKGHERAEALGEVAVALAAAGESDRAEAIADAVGDSWDRDRVLEALPGAMARGGNCSRAEILARTISKPYYQAPALADVALALAQAGHQFDARRVAVDAETAAYAVRHPSDRALRLSQTAIALAPAGYPDRASRAAEEAESDARSIAVHDDRESRLSQVVAALIQSGYPDRASRVADEAEATARAVVACLEQAQALLNSAGALREAGLADRAARAVSDAESIMRTERSISVFDIESLAAATAKAGNPSRARAIASRITDPWHRVRALNGVARILAETGDCDQARQIAIDAETAARAITETGGEARRLPGPSAMARALTDVAGVLVEAGALDEARRVAADAEAAARVVPSSTDLGEALSALACALAKAGDYDRALEFAAALADPSAQVTALRDLIPILAQAGDYGTAHDIVRAITRRPQQSGLSEESAWAVASLSRLGIRLKAAGLSEADLSSEIADIAVQAGDYGQAEAVIGAISDPGDRIRALSKLTAALTRVGEYSRARKIASSAGSSAVIITYPWDQAYALCRLAVAMAQVGHDKQARKLFSNAEVIARTLTDDRGQGLVRAELAMAAAHFRNYDEAETLVRSIVGIGSRELALIELVALLAESGEIARADAMARTITSEAYQAQALTKVAVAIAQGGDYGGAEALARALAGLHKQDWALGEVVVAIARSGNYDRADALARTITQPYTRARAFSEVTAALWRAQYHDRARQAAIDLEAIISKIDDGALAAKILAGLLPLTVEMGDSRKARCLAAEALIAHPAEWPRVVPHFLPAVVCDSIDVLAGILTPV